NKKYMDSFDMFSNWNKMFDKINRITNPLGSNLDWITRMNSINPTGLAVVELMRGFQNNNLYQYSFHSDITKNLNWINNNPVKSIIDSINNSIGINVNTEIFNKIDSLNYWSGIAKLAILDEFQSVLDEDELEDVVLNISNSIDLINSNLENIDKDPIAFFNNICISTKAYMDSNPSVKYSSLFIFWLISTILIPILMNKMESNDGVQISNSFNTTNNYYTNTSVVAKINLKSALIKNFPRDKSKTIYQFTKNENVTILKDSLKWALVIKTN
ncbi:hypothetical protein, partial [Flavobacterium psychrophilum]